MRTYCYIVTQVNILLHLSRWDFHSWTLTWWCLIHVALLIILPLEGVNMKVL